MPRTDLLPETASDAVEAPAVIEKLRAGEISPDVIRDLKTYEGVNQLLTLEEQRKYEREVGAEAAELPGVSGVAPGLPDEEQSSGNEVSAIPNVGSSAGHAAMM